MLTTDMATITSVVTKSEGTSSLEQIPSDIVLPLDTQVQIKMERGEIGVKEDVGELHHAEYSSHEGTGTTLANSAQESGTCGPDFVEDVHIKQETKDPDEMLSKLDFPIITGKEMRETEADMAHFVVDSAETSQDKMFIRSTENALEHAQTSSVSDASSLLKTVELPEELFMSDNEVELLDSDDVLLETMHNLHICPICNRKFKYASRLRKHLISHSSERKFKCDECGASFKVMSALKSHELTHSLDKPFMCDVCFYTYCTKRGLAMHIESKHGTGERRFVCDICGMMFLFKSKLKEHIERHMGKTVLCMVCGILFHTESKLKKHVARVHEFSVKKSEEKFECNHCDRSFVSKHPLRVHMMTVHLKETPFQCLICDKNFAMKCNLDNHMVCHTERKFKCKCGQSFTTKPSMERHSLTHINYRPYTCDWCGLTFTQKSSVERHIVVNMRGHYKRTGTCKPITGGRGGFYVSYW